MSLSEAVDRGGQRVLIVAMPRWLASRGTRSVYGLALIVAGGWPLLAQAVLLRLKPAVALHSAPAWWWLVGFTALNIGAMAGATYGWYLLSRAAEPIDRMLSGEEARNRLAAWMIRRQALVPQLAGSVVVALLGWVALARVEPSLRGHLEIAWPSYICVGWTCMLGGNGLYWFAVGVRLPFEIERTGPLALDFWSPASTAGLQALSGGYLYGALGTIVLSAVVELLGLLVPRPGRSTLLHVFVVGFPVIAVGLGLVILGLPHLCIARLVRAQKERSTHRIDERIGDPDAALTDDVETLARLIRLRESIVSSPSLPVGLAWLAPFVAALVGPLIAFLLARA